MQWKIRTINIKLWHRWFAWHPVRIGNIRVWFEFVYRRSIYNRRLVDRHQGWEYTMSEFDLLRDFHSTSSVIPLTPAPPANRISHF